MTERHRTALALYRTAPALAALALGAYWLPALAVLSPAAARPLGVDRRLRGGEPGVALTFDDGPHPQGTPAVLDLLDRAGARATFFLVGEQVERRPALAAEIVAAGHEVGVHCHRHRLLLRLGPSAVHDDLDRAAAAVAEATGRMAGLYRPPYGLLTAAAVAEARRRAWRALLWSRHGRDWGRRATAESIAARLARGLGSGEVLLLHDADWYGTPGSWRATVRALPHVLDALERSALPAVVPDAHR